MSKILVITSVPDVHTDVVYLEIQKLGGEIIRLNSNHFDANIIFNVTNKNGRCFDFDFQIKDSELKFDSNSFHTVWLRKPQAIVPTMEYNDRELSKYIGSEYNIFLQDFYTLTKNKRWINNYWANRIASCKLANLDIAKELGLLTPNTIVTNRASYIEEFAEENSWNILVKPFNFKNFELDDKSVYSPFSNKIDKEDFLQFKNSIKFSPTLIQEYIHKKIELRVTIIGSTIFTVAIDSQNTKTSVHDFRNADPNEVDHYVFNLPIDIEKKLLAFNQKLNLSFSTFDIILTPDDKYVFLECNPNGQWYWLELLTKLPMAETMAKYLMSFSNDLNPVHY